MKIKHITREEEDKVKGRVNMGLTINRRFNYLISEKRKLNKHN